MQKWFGPFRIFAYAVVLLMAVAMLFAAWVSVTYWSGIGV